MIVFVVKILKKNAQQETGNLENLPTQQHCNQKLSNLVT